MGKENDPKDDVRLTLKQRRFVDAYLGNGGNGYQAAKAAGYKGTYETLCNTAKENLRKPYIVKAIQEIVEIDPKVATRDQRQRFWTDIMTDPTIPLCYRLRASELLGKSQLDFIERTEVEHSYKPPEEMNADELDAEIARERERIAREG